ncbi:porin [Mesorhizobium koreense]|uniref:porin n=1 Tax=Mesorhizobium koreense TaxID=3074855 RepID=UPI00287B5D4F|nr:porin [Mesorhizobium sp. WR6]
MKIKSLILGSAAALLAVSGARAADAVMAPEPEPVDYVRVCDAYGAGFFYIPGTETCLSINGYVWFQVGATSRQDANDTPGYYYNDDHDFGPFAAHTGWQTGSRVRINFDARSETEWGTLRGWMRLQASWDQQSKFGDGPVGIDQAFVQLGGFAAGYGESAWFYQFNNSTLNYGSFSWGGLYYGYTERAQIRYEFGGKTGLYGAISLEDPKDELNYMPNVVGRIGYGAAWGAVALTGAYDHDRTGLAVGGDAGWALSGSALFNIPSMPGSALKIIGYYNGSDSEYGPGGPLNGYTLTNAAFPGGVDLGQPEWSVLASFLYQATPDLGLIVSGQYFGDAYIAGGDDTVNGTSAWAAEVSAVWTPVKNFEVRPEIVYTKAEHLDGTVSGFLRFTRYF